MAQRVISDIRIVKTKRSLVSALFTLLEKNSFQKITVNDICKEAMVSRGTFYLHFEDKYMLLHFCIETILQELYGNNHHVPMEILIRQLLERIQPEIRIFKNILTANMDTEVFALVHKSLHERAMQEQKEESVEIGLLPGPMEIITAFYAGGLVTAITLWVQGNTPYTIDEMTECLAALLPIE